MVMNNMIALAKMQENSEVVMWDAPMIFDNVKLPIMDISVFPLWIKKFIVGVAEETQTPVDASAIAALATLSTAISGNFEVSPRNGWTETVNLYLVLALDPANRKSSVFSRFLKPITNFERDETERLNSVIVDQQSTIKAKERRANQLEMEYSKKGEVEKLEEAKAVLKEISDEKIITAPRFITADATPEKLADLMYKHDEKISIMSAEGGEAFEMMAGRYSDNANIDIYLKAHAGDYVSIDRMGRDSIVLHKPNLTMGLFVQPSVIQDIPFNFQNRGLTQRFLYSMPKSLIGFRNVNPAEMKVEIVEEFNRNVEKLLRLNSEDESEGVNQESLEPIKIIFDNEAIEYLLHLEYERELMFRDPDLPNGLIGWIGKLTGQIIRIAALFHVADHVTLKKEDIPLEISKETLERANRLRDYFISHAEYAHGVMGVNEENENLKYLLKRIEEGFKGESVINYQDLWQLVKRKFKKAENLKSALQLLVDMGYLKNGKKDRKRIIYKNPYFFTISDTISKAERGEKGTDRKGNVPLRKCPMNQEHKHLGEIGEQSPAQSIPDIKVQEDGSGVL